jgi:RNA polymerase sigma-70 factor (ECF subfamily)
MDDPIRPFAEFYLDAKDRVFRAVLASGRNPTRAEDAVSEAFARAYERWETVGRLTQPTAWVVRVALNRYTSDWRIWHRERPDPPEASIAAHEPADDALLRLVWELPRRQRQVVALRVLADLAEADVATVLGISPKTVSVHLHRALRELRAKVGTTIQEGEEWKTQISPAE